MKPIYMDMHLELHARLVNNVKKNLSKTKKRLHEAELVLYDINIPMLLLFL